MEMRVRYLLVPSVKALVPMWRSAFGFTTLSLSEFHALEDRCAIFAGLKRSRRDCTPQ